MREWRDRLWFEGLQISSRFSAPVQLMNVRFSRLLQLVYTYYISLFSFIKAVLLICLLQNINNRDNVDKENALLQWL